MLFRVRVRGSLMMRMDSVPVLGGRDADFLYFWKCGVPISQDVGLLIRFDVRFLLPITL